MVFQKLFTLIELIVVIVVLGILAAIVVPNIKDVRENATVSALESDARNIETSVDMYSLGENGVYPTEDRTAVFKGNVDGEIFTKINITEDGIEKEIIVEKVLTSELVEKGYLRKESKHKKATFYLVEGGDVIWTLDGLTGTSGNVEKSNNPETQEPEVQEPEVQEPETPDLSKVGIDTNGDGIFDGFDTNNDGQIDIVNFDEWVGWLVWGNIYNAVHPEIKKSFYEVYPTYEERLEFSKNNPITVQQAKLATMLDIIELEKIEHLNGIQYLENVRVVRVTPGTFTTDMDTSNEFWNPMVQLAQKAPIISFGISDLKEADALALGSIFKGQFTNLSSGGFYAVGSKLIVTHQELNK